MSSNYLLFLLFFIIGNSYSQILPGAYQTDKYLPLLEGNNIGVVGNQSSLINNSHLVDSLLKHHITIKKVFAPEHGFRGKAEAGALLKDGIDEKSGLSVVSLYGENKKPTTEQLAGIDIMVIDLQGVGLRFYTYISTLFYVMEACTENNIPLIVLDRPNPNAHYIDGPVLDMNHQSFVGMLPIPIVYGMTDGELAQMINGEEWLNNGIKCDLRIIKIKNYNHQSEYALPVKPSPNLPNFQSIYLYASLCLFEGTPISIGRGTDKPFQQIGFPEYFDKTYSFTPRSISGVSAKPKFENQKCYGISLTDLYKNLEEKPSKLNLNYLIDFYQAYPKKDEYFNSFFVKLSGNDKLSTQIKEGFTEDEIRASWKDGLEKFKHKRAKYLLYL